MLDINVIMPGRVRHYSVTLARPDGWRITIEENRAVERREVLVDWHRVERTVQQMRAEVEELLEQGWILQPVRG